MTLHPVAVLDHAFMEYRDFLKTEFRARNEKLRQDLVEALERSGFLAQEPFYQAHRPFRMGARWTELGLEAKLAKALMDRTRSDRAFLHQSDAISHLLNPEAGPLVVTTGTGSGKTECFLIPVLQNAIADAAAFKEKPGLTAILVYPMNALATDQLERIQEYLESSGNGHVTVAKYDRSTSQEQRRQLRERPPHILLTNYMMLEYLLVRPADRQALFANHRCRFVVLDEVHTYRGSLGANIALLFRRLKAHLEVAEQSWATSDLADPRRFPTLIPVATSATIKSIEESASLDLQEVHRQRDAAVQQFLGELTGYEGQPFTVISEVLQEHIAPTEARWTPTPVIPARPPLHDVEAVKKALAALLGVDPKTPWQEMVNQGGILWHLGEMLAKQPRSVSQLVEAIRQEVPERAGTEPDLVAGEVEMALILGAALPSNVRGALRLRVHRFFRGGWRFHRCMDRNCGRLYAMGEERCTCGRQTAPLLLCRLCGIDVLNLNGDPEAGPLRPGAGDGLTDWVLYDLDRYEEDEDDGGLSSSGGRMRGRQVLAGSFDPSSGFFSPDDALLPQKAVLAPAKTRCLGCGSTAGNRNIITPVALGTSAAVRVLAEGLVEGLAEEHHLAPKAGQDDKERLLIFADSRQDAAHQARFITYAGRYDRMRRRLVQILTESGTALTLNEITKQLRIQGAEHGDNPRIGKGQDDTYLSEDARRRATAWEEAPLLDDLAVSPGYRATVFNLAMVGIHYEHLPDYVEKHGKTLAERLQLNPAELVHLCRCLLDEMIRKRALSRDFLRYHPKHNTCPDEFRDSADWERKAKLPVGFACDEQGAPVSRLDRARLPLGIAAENWWRAEAAGGRRPRLEAVFNRVVERFGGHAATWDDLMAVLTFLMGGPRYVVASKLFGVKQTRTLLQVNHEQVKLYRTAAADRLQCQVCRLRKAGVRQGMPCPACPNGAFVPIPGHELDENRYIERIAKADLVPLIAGEHTAQITSAAREALEAAFKAKGPDDPLNVLACSPTLEMGIDVGALDAVLLRNVPPRPDNYAQRGGRAARRERVGLVVSYTRRTPHDSYFYDKPAEMIAGEVPAPAIGLSNRDVIVRHLHALAFGNAEPGLAGRMLEYVDEMGNLKEEAVAGLVEAVQAQFGHAVSMAQRAWGQDVLQGAGFQGPDDLQAVLLALPERIHDVFRRVQRQIQELRKSLDNFHNLLEGTGKAIAVAELIRRILGKQSSKGQEADDRSAGNPMRRFAEFGILPGYEFPSEPSTLSLRGDADADEPIAVARRFGIAQYQPGAIVHARGQRWRVTGLDLSSPWNPAKAEDHWLYVRCRVCNLRFSHGDGPACPRCGALDTKPGEFPGHAFGGFLARPEDQPILEEEDRIPISAYIQCHPQWNGDVHARYRLATGWLAQVRHRETVHWINEGKPPIPAQANRRDFILHDEGTGFLLCTGCGKLHDIPADPTSTARRGRARANDGETDAFDHWGSCPNAGQAPQPRAIVTSTAATTLRIQVRLPAEYSREDYQRWGQSLGASLRIGMRQLYMLDGSEIEFELEPAWVVGHGAQKHQLGALTFVDDAVGGSGFLDRAAAEMHLVARRAIDHLDHAGCDSACYRCLKAYSNQRVHESLHWPSIMPHLQQLADGTPEAMPAQLGDLEDPTPWLEAYGEGVGSPLELRFLRLFQEHGLDVQCQVHVAPDKGGKPISVADFVVTGVPMAIYVDGAAFHKGARGRRDASIRERLSQGTNGWRVLTFRAADLRDPDNVIRQVKLAITPDA